MKTIIYGVTLAMALTLAIPAFAQVGVRVGEQGVGIRIGEGDRDHDRRWHHDRRNCETFWRHGERITECHR